jgi:PEP-CTERM motif
MHKVLRLLAVAAAAACSATAHAGVVDFNADVDTSNAFFAPLITHASQLQQNGYFIESYSTKAGADFTDLVGALVDGSNVAETCAALQCPGNNSTPFLAMLNSGLPLIGRLDGTEQRLISLDASFIAAATATVPNIPMILSVQGYDANGNAMEFEDIYLDGLVNGSLAFANYKLSAAFSDLSFSFFGFWAYACSTTTCTRATNTAQFAIDNITFADVVTVPEPSSLALFGLAAAGLVASRRRRPVSA